MYVHILLFVELFCFLRIYLQFVCTWFFCSNFHIILIYNLIFLNLSFNVRHEIQTIICLFLSFMAFLMGGLIKDTRNHFWKWLKCQNVLSFPPSVKEECVYCRFFLYFLSFLYRSVFLINSFRCRFYPIIWVFVVPDEVLETAA